MKYVNVYEVVRTFGGQEEGGWWYDHYECLQTYPVSNDTPQVRAEAFCESKQAYWEKRQPNTDIRAYVEDIEAEMETTEVPEYS